MRYTYPLPLSWNSVFGNTHEQCTGWSCVSRLPTADDIFPVFLPRGWQYFTSWSGYWGFICRWCPFRFAPAATRVLASLTFIMLFVAHHGVGGLRSCTILRLMRVTASHTCRLLCLILVPVNFAKCEKLRLCMVRVSYFRETQYPRCWEFYRVFTSYPQLTALSSQRWNE